MTLLRAERIMGHPVIVNYGEAGWITATATHPQYAYMVSATGKELASVLGRLVDENYRAISKIVMEEQGFRCLLCGQLVALEIDHITMRSHGRDDRRENLRALGCAMGCGCHARRHGTNHP